MGLRGLCHTVGLSLAGAGGEVPQALHGGGALRPGELDLQEGCGKDGHGVVPALRVIRGFSGACAQIPEFLEFAVGGGLGRRIRMCHWSIRL